jgi:hypothetical protein
VFLVNIDKLIGFGILIKKKSLSALNYLLHIFQKNFCPLIFYDFIGLIQSLEMLMVAVKRKLQMRWKMLGIYLLMY